MHIRTTKTSSGSAAVQVVHYVHRKTEVLAHIGSAKNEGDLLSLKKIASDWIHGKSNEQIWVKPRSVVGNPSILFMEVSGNWLKLVENLPQFVHYPEIASFTIHDSPDC